MICGLGVRVFLRAGLTLDKDVDKTAAGLLNLSCSECGLGSLALPVRVYFRTAGKAKHGP